MKYQIALVQNTSQSPFFHVEAETPLPTIAKGDLIQAGANIWEAQSILHRFLTDNTGTKWVVTTVLVAPPVANMSLAGGDLVPWPWKIVLSGWDTGNA